MEAAHIVAELALVETLDAAQLRQVLAEHREDALQDLALGEPRPRLYFLQASRSVISAVVVVGLRRHRCFFSFIASGSGTVAAAAGSDFC